jgi:hypothetical protein
MISVRCAEGLEGKTHVTVTVPVYHYGVLKGYLAAQNAPTEILAALEALYAVSAHPPLAADLHDTLQKIMEAADRLPVSPSVQPQTEPTEPPEVELPLLTRKMLEKAQERKETPPPAPAPKWEDPGEVEMAPFEPNPSLRDDPAEPLPKPRKKHEWSPEQRAAAAERMRRTQARIKAARSPRASFDLGGQSTSAVNPIPRVPEGPELETTDWPEIQRMLAAGRSREAIAGDYEVTVEHLDDFIAERLRERSRLGEAPALSQVGSA